MTKKIMIQHTKKRKRMKQMDQFMIMTKKMAKGEKMSTISSPRLPLYRQEKSDAFIPDEVILQILVKLPARSVGRFRCVCKSWLSATTNLPFIRSHTQHNRATCQSLIIHRPNSRKKYCLASTDANADANITLRDLPGRKNQIIASCDGLLCIRTIYDDFIVNPLTSYSIKLQRQDPKFERILGFYFHHSTSKYRVLRAVLGNIDKEMLVNVFLRGKGNIEADTFVNVVGEKSLRRISSRLPAVSHHGCIHHKGRLYWLAFTDLLSKTPQPNLITTFDTESEVYGLLSPPPWENQGNFGGNLVDFKGELGLWVMGNGYVIDVWIMEECWVKRYSLNYIDVNTCSDRLGVLPEAAGRWRIGTAGIVRGEDLLIYLVVSDRHHHLIRYNLQSGACCYQQREKSTVWLLNSFPYIEALTHPDCPII